MIRGGGEDMYSDVERVLGSTLCAVVPNDMELVPSVPRLGNKLKGSQIVFRWDVGWFHGTITHYFTACERRHLSSSDRDCNFEIKWTGEPGYDNQRLARDCYSIAEDAAEGSWAVCRPRNRFGSSSSSGTSSEIPTTVPQP